VRRETKNEQPLILLVEDREDDILVIQKAFERAKIPTAIQVARDGEEAISYLSGENEYSNRTEYPLPWLVLLDLKMPRMDGFEVLRWIRNQPGFKSIVVVVLTSSEQIKDVNEAYALGANSFMVKPLDFENTTSLARLIHHYWLLHNRFPEAVRPTPRKINGGKSGS
jgi:CheY-like chemotaxis protein